MINDEDSIRPIASQRARATVAVSGHRWYALAVMILIYSCHFVDRAVLSLVAEPVRREFGLSDSQLGVLNGIAFALMFAIAGIPIGLLVDRLSRRRLLATMVFLWSCATAACSLARSYNGLLIGRMAVGAAESGGAPTSLSLMGDYFPAEQRSTAVGLYYLGNAIGGLLCFFVGSTVAAQYGWRAALVVAGIPGVILSILAFTTLREPRRGGTEVCTNDLGMVQPMRLIPGLRQIAANSTLVYLFLATPLASAALAAAGSWLPAFFMRSHGMGLGDASIILGIAGGGFGALGSMLGGIIADRIARTVPARRAGFATCVLLLGIPAALGTTLIAANAPAIGLSFATFALVFAAIPVAFGSMLTITPPGIRGIASATMQVVTNLIGYGLGPLAVGLLSDRIGGLDSLRYAMAIVFSACCLGSALCFLLAGRSMVNVQLATHILKYPRPTVTRRCG